METVILSIPQASTLDGAGGTAPKEISVYKTSSYDVLKFLPASDKTAKRFDGAKVEAKASEAPRAGGMQGDAQRVPLPR